MKVKHIAGKFYKFERLNGTKYERNEAFINMGDVINAKPSEEFPETVFVVVERQKDKKCTGIYINCDTQEERDKVVDLLTLWAKLNIFKEINVLFYSNAWFKIVLKNKIAVLLYQLGVRPYAFTSMGGEDSYGYGKCDRNGFWEFPISSHYV